MKTLYRLAVLVAMLVVASVPVLAQQSPETSSGGWVVRIAHSVVGNCVAHVLPAADAAKDPTLGFKSFTGTQLWSNIKDYGPFPTRQDAEAGLLKAGWQGPSEVGVFSATTC
jgi:hypothetical protein